VGGLQLGFNTDKDDVTVMLKICTQEVPVSNTDWITQYLE
jgi:hypothetical protein